MHNVIEQIKDKIYLLLFLLFTGGIAAINVNLSLFGDDYYYGTFLSSDFWKMHQEHYLVVNGRALVHFLVSVIIKYETTLFAVINTLMIIGVVWFVAYLATGRASIRNNGLVGAMVLFSLIGINITRQSVYWLDGSFNYLFPMLLSLATFSLLLKHIETGQYKKLLVGMVILASITTEQGAMITIGGIFLILLATKFINKGTVTKFQVVLFGVAIVASLTLFLAPGTFVRVSLENGDQPLIENIKNVMRFVFFSKDTEFINLLYIITGTYIAFKKVGTQKLHVLIMGINMIMLVPFVLKSGKYLYLFPLDTAVLSHNVYFWIHSIVITLNILYVGYIVLVEKKNYMALASIVLAYGAQLMMVISPVYGYRLLLSSHLLLFIPIIAYVHDQWDDEYLLPAIGFALAIYFSSRKVMLFIVIMGAVLVFLQLINKGKTIRSWMKVALLCLMLLIVMRMSLTTIDGYRVNKLVDNSNVAVIKQYLEDGESGKLELARFPNDLYGWSYPYLNPYHMKMMKRYYNIPSDVEVIYKNR